jgi:CDP-diacylglycerol--glycerol-3-phosphate 3-phosphatidyltransferase
MKFTIPNQLTILRILLSPLFIYFFIQNSMSDIFIGTIVFFSAAATDWYDGYIARRFNIITRWGQFMDPLADKILISSAFFIFAYLRYLYWWMVIIIICRDFLITFLRIYALHRGRSIVTSAAAKWKTFFQMSSILFFLIYLNFPSAEIYRMDLYPPPYSHWLSLIFAFITLLTVYTGIQYLIENRRHLLELSKRTTKYLADIFTGSNND